LRTPFDRNSRCEGGFSDQRSYGKDHNHPRECTSDFHGASSLLSFLTITSLTFKSRRKVFARTANVRGRSAKAKRGGEREGEALPAYGHPATRIATSRP
jgi:hypothetical protein